MRKCFYCGKLIPWKRRIPENMRDFCGPGHARRYKEAQKAEFQRRKMDEMNQASGLLGLNDVWVGY